MNTRYEPLKVWYCGKCRRVLKCQPPYVLPKGCACKVPKLPRSATLVWDVSR